MISKNWLDLSYSAGVFIKGKSIMATENGGAFDGLSWRNRIIRKMIMKKRAFQSLVLTVILVMVSSISLFAQATYTSTAAGGNWNAPGTWTIGGTADGDGDGIPDANDAVIILSTATVNVNAASAALSVTINGSGIINYTSNNTLAIAQSLLLNTNSQITGNNAAQILTVGTTLTVGSGAPNTRISGITMTVNGTTSIAGAFTLNSDIGVKTFVGAVTNTGSWTSTAVATSGNLVFRGGIANTTGTLFSAGGATFNTNAQAITGTLATSFANNINITGIVLTYSNTANLSIGGTTTITGAGGFTDNSNSGIDTFTGNVSLAGTSTFTSTSVTTQGNMIFRGGIANSGTSFSAGGATFDTNAQAITGTTALSFANNVDITGVVVTNSNTGNFTIAGATSITGAGGFTDSSNSGIDTFTGNVSLAGTSTFNTTAVTTTGNLVFAGGIANSGSSFAAGGATFSATQSLSGTTTTSFANTVTVAASVTVTNNGIVTMSNTAAGTLTGGALSVFTQGGNSALNYAGQTITVTTFNATAAGNTVNYNGSVSPITVAAVNYYNLTYSGSAATANTSLLTTTVSGNLSITGSGTLNINAALTLSVAGNLTMNGSGQLTGPLATTIVNVAGNFSVASTATNARISTITLTVSGTSTIDGVFSLTNDTGVKTFTGAVTVSSPSGSWTSTSTTTTNNLVFKGGISNSGTFAAGTATFNTSSQALSGSAAMSFANTVTVTGAAVTLTNNNASTVTISNTGAGALAGTGIYVQGANSTLLYAGSTVTIGTFTPNGSDNTVNFTGTTPTVPNASYYHLTYSGSSSPTITSFNIAGDLTMGTGTFTSSGTVTFNGSTDQTVSASSTLTFSTLTLSTSPATVKVITDDNIQINTTINFTAGILVVGSSANVTLASGATFGSAGSTSSYIQLDGGTGSNSNVIKTSNGNVTSWRVTYPIGTATGGYTPISMPTMATNPTAAATLSVKAIYNSSIQGQLRRTFRIVVASNAATTTWSVPVFNYNLTSDVSGGDAIANYNTIWYLSTSAGSWTTIAGTNAGAGSFTVTTPAHNLVNGTYYYTIGTSTAYPNTWYSYQTGVWSDWTNWTLDPSGTTLVNGLNLPPQPGDEIVILNGITITNDVSGQVTSNTTINSGATLDMANTSGNTLGIVSGAGTLRLNGVALPTGNYTSFVTTTGGTVEYYNTGGTIPSTQTTSYNKLKLTNSTSSNITFITAFNLVVNGTMDVTQSSGGGTVTWQINNATAANLTMSVAGDLTVSASGKITAGTGNSGSTTPHSLTLTGNFINNGTVQFLDPTDAVFASSLVTGAAPAASVYANVLKGNAVNVTFTGTNDQTITCNSQTDFYRFIVNKGTGQQALAIVNSSAAYNLRLFGPANIGSIGTDGADGSTMTSVNALSIANGTLELTGTLTIPILTTIGSGGCVTPSGYNACAFYFSIPQTGGLWLNGATSTSVDVTVASSSSSNTDQRLLVQGLLKITNGKLSTGYSKGVNSGAAGAVVIEGGTLNTWQIRPTTSSPQNFSYSQSGGTVNVGMTGIQSTGVVSPGNGYARFSIASSTSSFQMTGGTLNVGTPTTNTIGGIDIQSSSSNYSVTNGTINVYMPSPSTSDFVINTTAPFYDLNVYNEGASSTNIFKLNQALTVLHNLTLISANGPKLYCASKDLTIGGDLDIQSGTALNLGATTAAPTGTNVITFNGSGAQAWKINNGASSLSNLSTVVLSKTAGNTLTLSGSALPNNIPAISTAFTLTSGILADGGAVISVTGTLTNNATITGTGAIYYNNAVASTIGGSGGTFSGLTINTNATVATSGTQTVSGTLRLLSASSTLNIASYSLTVLGNVYSDASTGVAFTSTKRIQTAGLRNDGGLTLKCTSGSDLLFPVGVTGTTAYTPATINVTATTAGTICMRPVTGAHPNATSTTQCLKYFWRLSSSGFAGISAVTHKSYTYSDATLLQGTLTTYTPARYDASTFTWTTGTVHTASGTIVFPPGFNFSFGTNIDGEYTTGNITGGVVKVFYSRQSGAWTANTTWSNSPCTGAGTCGAAVASGAVAGVNYPGANSPVVVGDANNSHTVTMDGNSRSCGSMAITANSVLDCSTYVTLNFGVQTTGTGRLRVASNSFPSGDFLNFLGSSGGTVEWYGVNTTTYQIPALSVITYNHLEVNPFAGQIIYMPASNLTIYGNFTKWGAGTVNGDNNASRIFTINGNMSVTDPGTNTSTLSILTSGGRTTSITLAGNLTVGSGATLQVSGGAVTHTLSIAGSISNSGTLNFNNGSSMTVTFGGTTNTSLTGTGTPTTTFKTIIVNKGTSSTPVLSVDVPGTLNVPSNNWLTLTNGTFDFNKTSGTGSSIILTNTATNPYTIGSTAKLKVSGGTVTVSSIAADDSDLLLIGALEVAGGTMNVGSSGNNNNNDIEYASAGTPTVTVSSGTLYVNGSIRRPTTTLAGALVYNQTGGTVTVGGRNALTSRGIFEIESNTGSSFTFTGTSALNIVRTTSTTSFADLYLNPVTSSVASTSTITMGLNTSTAQAMSYNVSPSIGNFSIVGGGTGAQSVTMYSNDMNATGTVSICSNCTLTTNSLNVYVGKDLSILGTYNGSNNTTTFNGTTAQIGTLSSTSSFLNMAINNTGGSTVSLAAGSTAPSLNNLNILSGTFDVGSLALTVSNSITNNSSQTGTGSITITGSATSHTITSSNGSFTNLILGGAAATKTVTVNGNMSILGTLTFNTTNRYLKIGSNQLTFGTSGAISGAGSTAFIKTNGVSSDLGVVKTWPVGTNSFTYAVGTRTNYTPVTYSNLVVPSGGSGTLTVIPVDDQHPTSSATGEQLLSYYWIVTHGSTLVYGTTGTQVYQFPTSLLAGAGGTLFGAYLDAINLIGWTSGGVLSTVGSNTLLTFTNSLNTNMPVAGGEFDYSCGTINTLPNPVLPVYSRYADADGVSNPTSVATLGTGGAWNLATNWTNSSTGNGAPLSVVPSGRPVVILPAARINMSSAGLRAFTTTVNGLLVVTTTGHSLGSLSGTGTMRTSVSTLPAGNYTTFVSSTGGTIEYMAPMTMNSRSTYNNLKVSGAGSLAMTSTDLTLNGSLTLSSGTTLTNTFNNNISVSKDWINNGGTFSNTTGTITFIGSSASAISGTTPTSLINVTMNKTGADLTPGAGAFTVTNLLTMTSGNIISTVGNKLTLPAAATVSGGSSSSFVIGPMDKVMLSGTTFSYPVGAASASRYRPAILGNTTADDTWTVEYVGNDPSNQGFNHLNHTSPINKVSMFEYWNISRLGSTASDVTLSYNTGSYLGSDIGNVANLYVVHWNTATSAWEIAPGGGTVSQSGTNIAGTVTTTNQTSFSPDAIGSLDLSSPLPVTWLAFTGNRVDNSVVLEWATAQERNNDHFEIQRSVDGKTFDKIGSQVAVGNSSTVQRYKFTDREVLKSTTYYYRIKQVDVDGQSDFSKVVVITGDGKSLQRWAALPNPTSDNTHFHIQIMDESVDAAKPIQIQIISSNGVIVYEGEGQTDQLNKKLDGIMQSFGQGIYIVQISDGTYRENFRIAKM
ncbi:MAG TPA: hypothetical protein VL443_02105 [Cyclobacteriaceae bacterium]|nr:hypothetical protein [Cyclobacteriaceae bacterium]